MRLAMKTRKATNRGFTMLELLVVVSIIGGIMATVYGVLFGTLEGKRKVELRVQGARIGPMILDQVERDLRRAFVSNLDHQKMFIGKSHRVNSMEADKFHFVSYTPSTLRIEDKDKKVFSAINEVGYVLTETAETNGEFMTLWRREDFFVDDEPLDDGYGVPLYRRIVGFNVRYFDKRGKDAKEEDKWDSESEDQSALPAAMLITLEYEIDPRDASQQFTAEELAFRRFTARRYITFGEEYAAAMSIRTALPVAPEGADNGAPGGKGGGGGAGQGSDGPSPTGGNSTTTGGGTGRGPGGNR
jgi:prepilin-type N-terminal cleavage/methylation domain-containing protein